MVRRTKFGSQVRLRVAPDGTLRASLPPYAPLFLVKRLLASNRSQISELIKASSPKIDYYHGMTVGKSHRLLITRSADNTSKVTRRGLNIELLLSDDDDINSTHVNRMLRDELIKAFRVEAKSYLPRRIEHLSDLHGFRYNNLRFSHSSGRWGSCNTRGTISLNIALMKLPFELIDYVILHELAHTKEMNHSLSFWEIVKQVDPNYKQNRKILKTHSPAI